MSSTESTYPSNFGEKLKFFRKAKGMTQAQLAGFIGIASDTLSRYERGDLTPSIDVLVKIVSALAPDVTADDLLFSSKDQPTNEIDFFGIATGLSFYGNEGSVTVSIGFSEIRKLLKCLEDIESKSDHPNQQVMTSLGSITEHFFEYPDDKIDIQANVPIGKNAIKFVPAPVEKKRK